MIFYMETYTLERFFRVNLFQKRIGGQKQEVRQVAPVVRMAENLQGVSSPIKSSRKDAYIILTPLNPTFI